MNAARSTWSRLNRLLRTAGGLVLGLLRELADERAYARHLAAHRRTHSADEWRRFSDARLRKKFAQGKCC